MCVAIDTIRNNQVFMNNAVVSRETFTGDFDALLSGEVVPDEWDENGEAVSFACLSES